MRFVFLKSLLVTLMVSSCGGIQIPAQTSPRSGTNVEASGSGNVTRVQSNRGNDGTFVAASAVTVGKGDTVYALSRRHRVPVSAIIRTNKLTPPYILQVGQRIEFPRGQQHRVQQGDTLYNIAQRYDVGLYELARLNGSEPPYTIKVGSILSIPKGNATSQTVTAASPTSVPRKPTVSSTPPASPPSQAVTKAAPQSSSVPNAKPAPRPAPKPVAIPKKVPVGDKVASLPPKKPSVPGSRVSAPPPKSGKGFVWPLKGRVVSNFGAKDGGLRNDGINIQAPRGTPVRAAENGVVAYAGNEIRGFGNLLLIKHSGGYVTAYAHNDALLVRRGQKVNRGQKISTVGATGTVASPQLHFEIRKGRRPQDPKTYLSRTS